MSNRNRNCIWHCGRETKNKSRVCDQCWQAAEILRSNSDAGFRAWCEDKRAKGAATKVSKPRTANQQAHLDKLNATRRPELAKDLPNGEV